MHASCLCKAFTLFGPAILGILPYRFERVKMLAVPRPEDVRLKEIVFKSLF